MNQSSIGNDKLFAFSQPSYEIPSPAERKSASGKERTYISWGEDNQYPQFLSGLYCEGALFQALVNNTVDYMLGDNVVFNGKPLPKGDDLLELVRKLALDLVLFNSCAVQRLFNPLGDLVGLSYIDFAKLRLSDDRHLVYYSNEWRNYTKKFVTLPVDDPAALAKQHTDVVIYKAPSKNYYPSPIYSGAIKSIVTLNKIDTFHLNNISNGFAASCIINFNNGIPSKDEKDNVETALRTKFAGEGNSGKFLVAWNESKDNEATVEKLSDDQFDKKFESLYNTAKQNLIMAFRCPALLIGSIESSNAFNTLEYESAFKLYNKTVVMPLQLALTKFMAKAAGQAGYISIVPYTINFENTNVKQ